MAFQPGQHINSTKMGVLGGKMPVRGIGLRGGGWRNDCFCQALPSENNPVVFSL